MWVQLVLIPSIPTYLPENCWAVTPGGAWIVIKRP
jgi:hypothetical protein